MIAFREVSVFSQGPYKPWREHPVGNINLAKVLRAKFCGEQHPPDLCCRGGTLPCVCAVLMTRAGKFDFEKT